MTFEEALKQVREMTEEEKNNLKCMRLTTPEKSDQSKQINFIVLELDPETEDPIDGPYNLMIAESILPEVYNIGEKALFNVNGKAMLFQILDVSRFHSTDILGGLTDKQKKLANELAESGLNLARKFPNDFPIDYIQKITFIAFKDINSGDPERIARAEKFIAVCKGKDKAKIKQYIEEYKKEADQ